MKYIALPNTWFKEGTEVELVDDYRPDEAKGLCCPTNSGLFRGIRICENPLSEDRTFGLEYLDEEICSFDEFKVEEV